MKRTALIAAILAVASTGSFAQSSTYIAAGLGTAKVDSEIANYSQSAGGLTFTQSADTNGIAFGLLLGHNFNSQWSLEGGYLNIRSLSANESIVATNAVVQGNTLNGSINARGTPASITNSAPCRVSSTPSTACAIVPAPIRTSYRSPGMPRVPIVIVRTRAAPARTGTS
jgi:hypothetical protein